MRIKTEKIVSFKDIDIGDYLLITNKNTHYTYLIKTEELIDSDKMYFVFGWRIENGVASSVRLRYRLYITNDINQYIIYKLSNKYLRKMFDTMACNFLLQIINN